MATTSFYDDIRYAYLVCFYNKDGEETSSPYQAQLWKNEKKEVFAKLCSGANNEFEGRLRAIDFVYKKAPIISIQKKHGVVKYQLGNVKCNTMVLRCKEIYFFDDDREVEIPSFTSVKNKIITPVNVDGSREMLKKHRKAGKMVSIYYVDYPHLQNKLLGIFRDVVDYDAKKQLLTTRKTKVFLLDTPA